MKIIEAWRTCEDFFESSEPTKTVEVQGISFLVPENIKYVCVEAGRPPMGVLQGFQKKPVFVGRWKQGKENPTVIACVTYEGDVREWLVEV